LRVEVHSAWQIDNVLIGGPAFISGKLSKGDVVLSVDGKEATIENVHDLLVGSDIPGADLHMRVMKNDSVTTRSSHKFPLCFCC
jgi:C-terminal processing protease CtpA/Prc